MILFGWYCCLSKIQFFSSIRHWRDYGTLALMHLCETKNHAISTNFIFNRHLLLQFLYLQLADKKQWTELERKREGKTQNNGKTKRSNRFRLRLIVVAVVVYSSFAFDSWIWCFDWRENIFEPNIKHFKRNMFGIKIKRKEKKLKFTIWNFKFQSNENLKMLHKRNYQYPLLATIDELSIFFLFHSTEFHLVENLLNSIRFTSIEFSFKNFIL